MKQLAAFRAQGDDALHRQISADADLLGFDDMPKSVSIHGDEGAVGVTRRAGCLNL